MDDFVGPVEPVNYSSVPADDIGGPLETTNNMWCTSVILILIRLYLVKHPKLRLIPLTWRHTYTNL